jgi:hypothetical protein
MVSVTKDTLTRTAKLLTRDVLKNNITDPIASTRSSDDLFIWNSAPNKTSSRPYIIIENISINGDQWDLKRSKLLKFLFSLRIAVVGRDLGERDTLTDLVVKNLSDQTKTDVSGGSFNSNKLSIRNSIVSNSDFYSGVDKIVRMNTVEVNMAYGGS